MPLIRPATSSFANAALSYRPVSEEAKRPSAPIAAGHSLLARHPVNDLRRWVSAGRPSPTPPRLHRQDRNKKVHEQSHFSFPLCLRGGTSPRRQVFLRRCWLNCQTNLNPHNPLSSKALGAILTFPSRSSTLLPQPEMHSNSSDKLSPVAQEHKLKTVLRVILVSSDTQDLVVFKINRFASCLAATVVLLGSAGAISLKAQSTCSSTLFTIGSSSGTSFPAAGGSTTISWNKASGSSSSCPSFITTTAPWLTLQGSNSTSTTGSTGLSIAPNLSNATRSGVITVQSSATDSTNFTITQVGTTLTADQASLTFSAPGGVAPVPQTVNVTASGGAVLIGVQPASTGNWLSVTPSSPTAPSALMVSANPFGLAAGTYQGSIQVNGAGLQIVINVTLTVTSANAVLSFNPGSEKIAGLAGNAGVQTAAVVLKNTGASASTVFTLVSDQTWLTADSSGVSTLGPGVSVTVTLTASAATLSPGTYTAHVTAQGAGTSAILTVSFIVTGANVSALVNPITLTISSGAKKTFAGVEQLAGDSTTVAISVTQGASYLSADATAKSPGSFSVTIDASALSPGSYSGALLVQCTGSACLPVPVQVIITVNPASGALNFLPAAETLSMISGSATPQTAAVGLENDGSSATGFTISADQTWLSATPASGNLNPGQKTTVSISASASNLPPGTYTGHVLANGTGTTGTYTVSLTVTGANVMVTPNPLTLTLPAATKQTFPGALQLTGDAASVSIGVTQGNAYLTADAVSQSPGSFSVTVDATKLAPATYPGALVVHCNPGCAPTTVSVSIVVTQGASSLTFGSAGANLSGNAGSLTPQTTTTTVQNAGNSPGYFTLVSDQNWLSANPASGSLTSGQSTSITISAASQYLAPGSYTGHLTVGTAVFTVNFTVAGVQLFVSPSPANFTVAAGGKQTFNTEQVLGGSTPVSIAVTAGSIWLSADTAVQAPGFFNITIDATYLKPGSYTGTLAFACQTNPGVPCAAFSLPINLVVTSNSFLQFTPSTVTITSYQGRQAPLPQTVSVKSSDGSPINFTVTNPFSWLTLSSLTGTTPATLTLTPNLTGVTGGTSGNLTFTTANSQSSVLLPVVLNLTPFTIGATPSPLAISAIAGQKTTGSITVGTADNGSASLQVSTTTFWLSVPASFTAPGAVSISVDASLLGSGTYSGSVTLACASANPCQAVQVPVNLTVTNSAVLQSDTQSIAFPLTSAGTTQLTQAVHLTSSDNVTAMNYTIDPTTLPNWLTVSTDRLTTPATVTFSVPNPPSLASTTNVKINSAYGSVVIVITYTPVTGPSINNAGVVSAGGSQNQIRSGSWAAIYGSKLSTTAARGWNSADFNGNAFPTSLDGVSVSVGGQAAFVQFISPTQIDFQCPDGIGTGLVPVTVTNRLGTSNTVMATIGTYAPAFFIGTATASRNYLAATEAPSGGTVYIGPPNTTGVRPAKAGENLTLWGTGFGPTTPNIPAGSLFGGAAPLNDPVQILIDGVSVTPQFAGISAAGLYQINIVVPNLSPGDHQLTATIGGVTTASGIWLSTQ